MTWDAALPLACTILTAPLLAVLIRLRVYRSLPIFVVYQGYNVCAGLAAVLILRYAQKLYLDFWIADAFFDAVLCLAVMVEVGRNLLRYNHAGASRQAGWAFLFPLAGVMMWFVASWKVPLNYGVVWWLSLRLLQATAILEVAAVLTLAWWSTLEKLHWPERELKVVSGLGFAAMVEFAVVVLHEHGFLGRQYHWLDLLPPASDAAVLVYWLHYFWLKHGGPERLHHDQDKAVQVAFGSVRQDSRGS
jgi:hypothetical protein